MWPWNSEEQKEEIEQLEQQLQDLEQEKEKWENRFKAEKERRSKLSSEKQQAEEKINRLQDKIEGLKSEKQAPEETNDTEAVGQHELNVEQAQRVLDKLSSIKSPGKDLVTVYHTGSTEDIDDLRGLKNSITGDQFRQLSDPGVYLFDDDEIFDIFLDARPFFDASWSSDKEFSLEQVAEFISREKIWAQVSAGDTKIFREAGGELKLLEHVKGRVDRKHSSGGFSQGRFERKREEQIENHLDAVEEALPEEESILLVGDRSLCKELSGRFLGGFDPNRSDLEGLYGFGFRRL